MKSDGTWVKAVHQNEDTSSGVKTFTFDDDYNIEIMFQNGLSNEQKSNFKFKEENNMAIKSADQITIIDVTDAYSVMLTSEAYTFVGGTGGVGSGQTCTTEAVAFCGTNQCASVSVNASDITCPNGITATVENSGTSKVKITFKTTATINAACEATIPIVVDGITMNKKFSFAVARTGNTGATGNGISKAEITYAASSSNTTAPTSGWQSTPPSVSAGQYLWTKTVFTYTNGGTATQYSVAKQGSTGAAGADAISLTITSSNGIVFKNNTGSTVLTAHVWKGAVEQAITDAGVCGSLGSIKWYKVGSDTAIATAKTLTVSANDVLNSQAYTCQLEG